MRSCTLRPCPTTPSAISTLGLTYDINHRASVRLAEFGQGSRREAFRFFIVLQHLRSGRG